MVSGGAIFEFPRMFAVAYVLAWRLWNGAFFLMHHCWRLSASVDIDAEEYEEVDIDMIDRRFFDAD